MSTDFLPRAPWQSGTNQNSIPANDNTLRTELMERPWLGVENSPPTNDDGDVYIVGDTPADEFATFDENDVAIYRSGTWKAWAPFTGMRGVVSDIRVVFDGSDWINDPSIGSGTGTVTSVDLTLDATIADLFSASGGPITGSGAITLAGDDPGADRIAFWDDSASKWTHLEVGSGLSITGTVLSATGGSSGDVVGPSSATADSVALFDGTTGKLLKDSAKTIAQIRQIEQNSQSGGGYTLVLTDAGKHILHPSADTTGRTWTIPANSSVAFPIGTAITFVNQNGAGAITIAITTDTLRLAGAGTTGSRTLAANGIATALKVTSTEWLINGTGLT